jgi:hypothetical protein
MEVAKVLVSFEDGLLRWIDRAAKAAGLSRSAYLSHVLDREREQTKGPGADPEVRRALAQLDRLFADVPSSADDSTDLIRAMRDSR